MLKVYFAASVTNNETFLPSYKHILEFLKQYNAEIISGEQIVNPDKKPQESPENIFQRQKSLIDQADAVVAETTIPSLGVGGEIVYALTQNKPVLALVQVEHEDKISPMIEGNPSANLFLEFYHDENIKFCLKNFLDHVEKTKKRKGKLIVIDGGDGSGKSTQGKMLADYLKSHNIPTKYMDFPQYYQSFHGKVVAKFLRGEFGNIEQVSPYLASLAYALDRASVKQEMEEFLDSGGFIIANRYATSNMAHQGAKFKTEEEQKEYLDWVYELEYKVHKIPKEDLVIYLYVPWQVGAKLTEKKGERKYLGKETMDIQEKDLDHRAKAEQMYLKLAKNDKHWVKIDCVENDQINPKEQIHQQIIAILKEKYGI